jgi:hypothetical protein
MINDKPQKALNATCVAQGARGRHQKKSVTPVVGGWVEGQKRTGVDFLCVIFVFNRVFELPSPRNAQKCDKQIEKNRFGIASPIFL